MKEQNIFSLIPSPFVPPTLRTSECVEATCCPLVILCACYRVIQSWLVVQNKIHKNKLLLITPLLLLCFSGENPDL